MGQLLSGTYAGLGVFEGYTASQAAPLFESLAAAMQGTGEEDDRPFAYLNFALFAHDMSLLDAGWERIPEEAGFASGEESLPNRHKRVAFSTPVVVPEDGFIYIWLSNESEGTEVWFDDLSIRHTQTLVAQATDYGVWGEVLREQRSDARKYRYGYQGSFSEKDEETGWNHFELRQYDAVIGRWLSADPYRVGWSPYIGMANNPVSRVDPDGGCPDGDCGDWWNFGDVLDLGEITFSYKGNYSDKISDALDDFWNSPLARWLVPDVATFGLGEGATFFIRGKEVSGGYVVLFRGEDKGIYPMYSASNNRAGFMVKGEIFYGFQWKNGDPRTLKLVDVYGQYHSVNAGFILEAGGQISFSEDGTVNLFGGSVGFGVVLGVDYGKGYSDKTWSGAIYNAR
jgi:RHS repeat-associated protein